MFLVARELDRLRMREVRLARLLEQVADDYDHALIDCPPALDALTDNALAAADGVLIPVQPERSSVRALRLLLDQIQTLETQLRRAPIELHGTVPSCYRRPLSVVSRTVMTELDELSLPVLAHLPLSVTVTEGWEAGQPVTITAPKSEQAGQYRIVARALDAAVPAEVTS
jgi:chromosome partitioning protein